MRAQWQPNLSLPDDYPGPSFRRGEFLAVSRKGDTQILWHVFRVCDNGKLVQLPGECEQDWNAGECIDFPRTWADEVISQAGS